MPLSSTLLVTATPFSKNFGSFLFAEASVVAKATAADTPVTVVKNIPAINL